MKMVVIFKAPWSDEIDCEQFVICDTIEEAKAKIDESLVDPHSIGTNEYFEPEDMRKDDFEIVAITEEFADVLAELIGKKFGVGVL